MVLLEVWLVLRKQFGDSIKNVSFTIHPDYWPNDDERQVTMAVGQQAPAAMIEAQSVISALDGDVEGLCEP
jgi:hypothetical protein